MPGKKFLIDVETRFTQTGVDGVTAEFKKQLQELAAASKAGLSNQGVAQGFQSIQGSAERGIRAGEALPEGHPGHIPQAEAVRLRAALTRMTNSLLNSAKTFDGIDQQTKQGLVNQLKSQGAVPLDRKFKGADRKAALDEIEQIALRQEEEARKVAKSEESKRIEDREKRRRDQERKLAQREQERIQGVIDGDPDVVAPIREERRQQNQYEAAELRALTDAGPNDQYAKSITELASAQNNYKAFIDKLLVGSKAYLKSTVEATNARNQLKAAEAKAALEGGVAESGADRKLAEEALARAEAQAINKSLLKDPSALKDRADTKLSTEAVARQENILVEQGRVANEVLTERRRELKATRQRQIAEEKLNAAVQQELAAEQASANLATKRSKRAVESAELSGTTQKDIQDEASNAARRKKFDAARKVLMERELALSKNYNDALAESAAIRSREAQLIKAKNLGIKGADRLSDDELAVEVALRERAQKERRAAAVAERVANNEGGILDSTARKKAADQRAANAINQQVGAINGATAAEKGHAAAAAQLSDAQRRAAAAAQGQPTYFQKVQARFAGRVGEQKDPLDFQTGGQFIGSKLTTTIGFAASGALLYGGITAVKELIDEAEKLERIMNQVRAQFESIGEGAQFAGARDEILAIARDTGAAADEIATVFFQFKGAFGDTTEALEETRTAMEGAKITGLELKEIVDSLTGIKISFAEVDDFEQIFDSALGLQERFGVLAKETITFTADIAPVAESIGLEFEEMAALGATAQQASGRSGTAIAEGLGRILPTLQNVKGEILNIYTVIPELSAGRDQILGAFADGAPGQAFIQLARDYDKLSESQQAYVIELLGGRREAQVLIPILENNSKLIQELDGNYDDAGKSQEYFNDLQETVANTMARLGETFKQIGESLFDAGLADILTGIGDAAALLGNAVGGVAKIFGFLNEQMNGIPTRALVMLGLFKSLRFVFEGLTPAIRNKSAAMAADTATTTTNSTANQVNTGTEIENALAKGRTTVAIAGKAAASRVQQGFSGGNTFLTRDRIGTGSFANPKAGGTSGGAVAALGVSAGLLINDFYQNKNREIDNAVNAWTESLSDASKVTDEMVNELAAGSSSFWERVAVRFFGNELPEDLANEEKFNRFGAEGAQTLQLFVDAGDSQTQYFLDFLQGEYSAGFLPELDNFFNTDNDAKSYVQNNQELFLPVDEDGNPYGATSAFVDDAAAYQFNPDALDQDAFEKLLKQRADGGQTGNIANQILASLQYALDNFEVTDPEIAAELDAVMTDLSDKAEEEAKIAEDGQGAVSLEKLESVRKKYEEGIAGPSQYLTRLEQEIRTLEDLRSEGGGVLDQADAEALIELRKTQDEFTAAQLERSRKYAALAREASGTDTPENEYEAVLADLRNPDITFEEKAELVPEAVNLARAAFEEELESIDDVGQRLARAQQGFSIDPVVNTIAVLDQLRANVTFDEQIRVLAEVMRLHYEDLSEDIAEIVATTDLTIIEATRQIIIEEIFHLASLIQSASAEGARGIDIQIKTLQEELANIDTTLAELNSVEISEIGTTGSASTADLRDMKEEVEEADDYMSAWFDLQRAIAGGDAVAAANIDIQEANYNLSQAETQSEIYSAQAEQVRAVQAYNDAVADINLAQSELFVIQNSFDPVTVAREAIHQANVSMQLAEGQAERIRAQIEMVEAQRQMQEAMLEVFTAQQNLLIAVATAAGDSVEVARLQAEQLQKEMQALLAQGADRNDPAVTNLEAQIVSAEAQIRDAKFTDRLGDIEFLLEMEKITTGQAIEMLQSLAQIPNLTEDQLRTIQRKIKSLQGELSSDFQFNLPDTLLPTLFEARRINQGLETVGTSHVDNRVIDITINVSNDADRAAVEGVIADALTTNRNVGNRRY